MSNWKPIETAAADADEVLVFVPSFGTGPGGEVLFASICTDDNEWHDLTNWDEGPLYAPTHRMPLPEPPKVEDSPEPWGAALFRAHCGRARTDADADGTVRDSQDRPGSRT